MKTLLMLVCMAAFTLTSLAQNQNSDKSKRPSPPVTVTQKIKSGATLSITYGQVSLKNRTVGKDVEPMEGKIWRTGANEASTFKTDQAVKIGDATLPAGTYSFFTIYEKDKATIIFNKTVNQWGAFSYKQEDDVLRVPAKLERNVSPVAQKLMITITPAGQVSILWGDTKVHFQVQ